mmetsp:Transcript_28785/g.90707  ORF Transcript_28785/g.90707 Transcript_28785/m.90707 type:complete len:322 (+) Transcript_28785:62-1027(+)
MEGSRGPGGGAPGPGRLVFDVGANFGQSAERYLRAGYRVVAVEPNPEAAEAIRRRLRSDIDAGRLVVEERAVWPRGPLGPGQSRGRAVLYVNEEDSEWSSLFASCGRRYDTEAREVGVETTTLQELYGAHGPPFYVKIDVEGSDGICLEQLQGLRPPLYLSFELNSVRWLDDVAALGYTSFKVVAQAGHKAEELLDGHGRPLTHAGAFGEEAVGEGGDGSWRSLAEAVADVRRLCFVHDEAAGMEEFAAAPPRFVERDFATLRACFPVESRDDEEWYDVHCRHSSALAEEPRPAASRSVPEPRERSRSPPGGFGRESGKKF